MCAFAADLIDYEGLSDAQKGALVKDLQKRRMLFKRTGWCQ